MQQHKGFSLLEVLVAFAIMAVALTIVLRIFGSGVNNAVVSEEYTLAVQMAESLMARTGVETPLSAGEMSGSEGDKYDWFISIRPVDLPQSVNAQKFAAQQANQPQRANLQLMAVNVIVSWNGQGDQLRSVELHTLKLVQGVAL